MVNLHSSSELQATVFHSWWLGSLAATTWESLDWKEARLALEHHRDWLSQSPCIFLSGRQDQQDLAQPLWPGQHWLLVARHQVPGRKARVQRAEHGHLGWGVCPGGLAVNSEVIVFWLL